MTREKHIKRHEELHEAIDELIADYIRHNSNKHLTDTNLMELVKWSHEQTINPAD